MSGKRHLERCCGKLRVIESHVRQPGSPSRPPFRLAFASLLLSSPSPTQRSAYIHRSHTMSDQEQNDAPQAPKPEGVEQLNIKVKDAEGGEVFFKVKRSTKLAKLKRAYADRVGKPENSVRFIFDGQRIGDDDTADSVSFQALCGDGRVIVGEACR